MADEPTGQGSTDYTPPATQEDLNAIIKDRIDRERRKYADYEDLKAKAARLDEVEAAHAAAMAQATERAEEAERLAAERTHALDLRMIAEEYGIATADLDFIDAPDADAIRGKAQRFAERHKGGTAAPEKPEPTNRVGFSLDGTQPPSDPGRPSKDDAARKFFGI